MPTGSSLWHFLYRLVRKFIRSVVSSEKVKSKSEVAHCIWETMSGTICYQQCGQQMWMDNHNS